MEFTDEDEGKNCHQGDHDSHYEISYNNPMLITRE